ncbi:T9SS type A sorting domain-containing protein [Salinivirga cyanobacteriivorans]
MNSNHTPTKKISTHIFMKSLALIFVLFGMNVFGQTSTSDGLWNDANNWDAFFAPGYSITDDILIANVITSNDDIEVRWGGSLIIGNNDGVVDSLVINGTLTSTIFTTINIESDGVLLINGNVSNRWYGTINVDGKFLVDGDFDNFFYSSDVNVSESGQIGVSGDFNNNGDVSNTGDINVGGNYNDNGNTSGTGTIDSGDSNPLPVEFGNLTYEITDQKVILEWFTYSERNNDYFTIELSKDLNEWSEIGRVEGNGNTAVLSDYQFEFNEYGSFYIRLSQFDYDGTNEVLDLIHIQNENTFTLYPNPVKAQNIDVLISNLEGLNYRIFNQRGAELTANDNFEKGIYFVHINNKMHKLIVR